MNSTTISLEDIENHQYQQTLEELRQEWMRQGRNWIPPMIHPLSKNWDQPKRENILVDDTHALMTRHDFGLLLAYSHTVPTGCYEGKMWKMQFRGQWALRWYCPGKTETSCAIQERAILLV